MGASSSSSSSSSSYRHKRSSFFSIGPQSSPFSKRNLTRNSTPISLLRLSFFSLFSSLLHSSQHSRRLLSLPIIENGSLEGRRRLLLSDILPSLPSLLPSPSFMSPSSNLPLPSLLLLNQLHSVAMIPSFSSFPFLLYSSHGSYPDWEGLLLLLQLSLDITLILHHIVLHS